ncbi:probable disease resistance protein At4g27220 isoform X2 [Arachis hypogaea]
MAGSSNQVEAPNELDSLQGLAHSNEVVGSGNIGFGTHIKKMHELVNKLSSWEAELKDGWQWLEYCGKKCEREELNDWLKEAGGLKEEALEIIESLHQHALQDPLKKTDDFKSKLFYIKYKMPFCLNKESVDRNFIQMRDLLRDDNVFFIGVCGMGGVGKTWLVTHFKNQIRSKKSFNFENVYWVTVSQDFSILKLQNSIAKRIGEKLDDDDEITDRAEILSSALEKIDRSVLILDNVWNYIDLQKVGIPLRTNGIKLILTSRLKHVFQQMDCPTENLIQMKPFHPEDDQQDDMKEGWELFLLKLGCNGRPATLSDEVKKIARSVVEICDGLPLGISVMARLMKGVNDDINIWRHALSKLEDSSMGEAMEEEVIKVLKQSYDYLGDSTSQNCFLQHALYSQVSAEVLFMNLVDEGLIQSTRSLDKIFVQGQAILAKLNSHSLISWVHDWILLRHLSTMHSLLRDMASDIMKGRFMLRCRKGLKNIPEMQEWTPHLEKASLMDNDIKEIPEATSPMCPQLSTLNLSKNRIRYIPNCFFNHLEALSLLDLSYNAELTSLPNSLSSLKSLKSLLLERCYSLKYVPPLGELQELSRLVISDTLIEDVPHGLGMLAKLRWLDLSNNRKLVCVPWPVISGLTNVQYLNLQGTSITGHIVQGVINKLEYFQGSFQVAKNLADFMENTLNRDGGLKYYDIDFRSSCMLWKLDILGGKRKRITVGDFEGFEVLLPSDLQELNIRNNKQLGGDLCECGALSLKAPSLKKIDVSYCPKLERLCCLSGPCFFCQHLQNLQSLVLYDLERLDTIWREDDEFIGLPNLSELKIQHCNRMERLMRATSLAKLPKLERIQVDYCKSIKEIFTMGTATIITLPNSFRELCLWGLPQLGCVCDTDSIIVSNYPPEVTVFLCPELRSPIFDTSHL